MKLGTQAKRDIARQMENLTGASASTLAHSLAHHYGCAVGTIYAVSRAARPERRRRLTAGSVACLSADAAKRFEFLVGGHGLSSRKAREVCLAEGYEMPSQGTLDRYRRVNRLTRREIKQNLQPCVRFEAPYPNRLWQVDSKGSEIFFQGRDGSVVYLSPLKRVRNKPAPTERPVWIVAILDDFSRAAYAEFVPANDTQGWLTAFGHAASDKADLFPHCDVPAAVFPFRGLPEEVYTDQDSVAKSLRWDRVMSLFDPPVMTTLARRYSPRSKGKVEKFIQFLEGDFEAVHRVAEVPKLAIYLDQHHDRPTAFTSLDEANRWLQAWLLEYNNRVHSATGEAPFSRWIANVQTHGCRQLDADHLWGIILTDWQDARLNQDLTLRVNGHVYRAPRIEPLISAVGKRVRIWWSPRNVASVYVDYQGASYEIHESGAPATWGEIKAIPLASHQAIKQRLAREGGAPPKKAEPERVIAEAQRHWPGRHVLTTLVAEASIPADVRYSFTDALRHLVRQGVFHRYVTDTERAALVRLFDGRDAIDQAEVGAFGREFRSLSRGVGGAAA